MTDPPLEPLLELMLVEHEEATFVLKGTCMEPSLLEGASVTVVRVAERAPKPGDVVLVKLPAGLKLHWLISTRGPLWRTRPGLGRWDPPVHASAVKAVLMNVNHHPFVPSARARSMIWAWRLTNRLRRALGRDSRQ